MKKKPLRMSRVRAVETLFSHWPKRSIEEKIRMQSSICLSIGPSFQVPILVRGRTTDDEIRAALKRLLNRRAK